MKKQKLSPRDKELEERLVKNMALWIDLYVRPIIENNIWEDIVNIKKDKK